MDCVLGGLVGWVFGLGDLLKNLLCLMLLAILGLPAQGQDLMAVPSGQAMLPYEALWEDHLAEGVDGETWLILRFLAPGIAKSGGAVSFADAEPDLDFICTQVGLPLAELTGGGVDQIIVTFLDKPLPRGERDASVTQFMNAYRVVKGACKWE